MKSSCSLIIGIPSLALLLGAYSVNAAPPMKLAQKVAPMKYAKVAPIFDKNCVGCHSATRPSEKVDLSSYAAVMRGGKRGPIVIAKNPMKSDLLLYVNGTKSPRMPLRGKPLSAGDVATIQKWIAQGAKP
jgi:hypothetical protein